jgi:hypothetical protein
MENGFCIILSKYRLYQGVALYNSIKRNIENPKIFILCMDDESYEVLLILNLENVNIDHVQKIENHMLKTKKNERKLSSYCWTLKPIFLEYVMNHFKGLDRVTYVDADEYFFSDPSPVFEEGINSSVLLSKHNFTRSLKNLENICGKYNSGFISFKRDRNGIDTLNWWKERCLEWCYEEIEKSKFGDQKYLEDIPLIFNNVSDIKIPGVNIGGWNHGRYKPTMKNNKVYINNVPLILYHFAGFRLLSEKEFAFIMGFKKEFIEYVYNPYIYMLQEIIAHIKDTVPHFNGYFVDRCHVEGAKIYRVKD